MTETFYDVLGVSPDATTEEIEDAYREAIKETHPDVSDDADAGERTKRLNRAKRVLTDESERSRYDRIGHDAYVSRGPGTASGTDSASDENGHGDDATGTTGQSWADRVEDVTGSEYHGESTWHGRDPRRRAGRRRRGRRKTGGDDSTSHERGSGKRGDGSTTGAGSTAHTSGSTADATRSTAHTSGSTADATRSTSGPGEAPWESGFDEPGSASRSARRQAAAAGPEGPNVEWSWNDWTPEDAWAVRGGEETRGLRLSRLFPREQSVVLVGSSFLCYPLFVGTVLFPAFPIVVRLIVAVCTLLMFGYLLSMPEVAVLVYGGWSLLGTLGLFVVPGVGVLSLAGLLVLVAAWVPLGLAVVTLTVLRL